MGHRSKGMRGLRTALLTGFMTCASGLAVAATIDQLLNDGCALTAVLGTESGGATNIVNARGTAAGRTQITLSTMVSLGAATCNTAISGGYCRVQDDAYGMSGIANRDKYARINPGYFPANLNINSWQDVYSGPNALAAQQVLERAYFSSSLAALERNGVLAQYAGNSNNALGVQMNPAAILQCAQAGAANCRSMLANGTSIAGPASEIRAAITRSGSRYNPNGNCEAANLDDGVRDANRAADANGAGTDNGGLYCDPEVLKLIQDEGALEVDRRVSLATDKNTGYTTLGGRSVLDAAGVGTSGGSSFDADTGSFRGLSCLNNLFGGLRILFSPPNLGMLLSALEGAVCNKLNQLYTSVTQPLQQSLYRNANLDSFLPGYGLSSLGAGVNVSRGGSGISAGYTNTLSGGAGGNIIGNTGYGYGGQSAWGQSLFIQRRY